MTKYVIPTHIPAYEIDEWDRVLSQLDTPQYSGFSWVTHALEWDLAYEVLPNRLRQTILTFPSIQEAYTLEELKVITLKKLIGETNEH